MSQRSIVEKIKDIKDEVRQLHPLLDAIFHKMESIKKVEYTHGNTEMGADFVLTKISEELGDAEYIGVIAKADKILQDYQELKRQIEECNVKRFIDGGKKEVYLSGIWVVSTSTISNNAQSKIWEAYKSHKVRFIDGSLLARWTEKYVQNYGMDIAVKEGEFLQEERRRAIERDIKYSLFPVHEKSLYVDQEIIEIITHDYEKSYVRKKISKKEFHEVIQHNKIVVIEAPMGGGKSKLLNKLVESFADPENYLENKLIPIYVHCRDIISEKENALEDFIAKLSITNGLGNENKYLLLIDGLDEAKLKKDDGENRLISLLNDVLLSKSVHVILATRMLSNTDLEAYLSTKAKRFEIQPLSLNKVITFIESICTQLDLTKRLIEDLKKTALFKVLPRTPIAAIILAKLINEQQEDLPANLTELYSKYTELSLGRWDVQKGLVSQKEYTALSAILSELSVYMLDNEIPALSEQEVKDVFQGYLTRRNLGLNVDNLFDQMLSRSDLMVLDERHNTISFKHKSFAEYFYAKSMIAKGEIKISTETFHPYWLNCYFFYVGLKRDCPKLLNEIINFPTEQEGTRISKLINLGNFLLAGYETEYAVVASGVQVAFKEAAQYYLDIAENGYKSPLSRFPKMQLLAIFRHLMGESYSYSYFQRALTDSIMEIATNPSKNVEDAYTLFFMDIARLEVGADKVFDRLVDIYDDQLPIPLQLALHHEADKNKKIHTPIIKKIEKRLKKHRKDSESFDALIVKMYDQTIDGKVTINRAGKKMIGKTEKNKKK